MPTRARHGCKYPGCPNLVDGGGAYCSQHRGEGDRERGSAASRGYGATWKRYRKMYLARHPLCTDPYERHVGRVVLATDVDHIVPLRAGGGNQESNLQSLCHECHTYKTLVLKQ